MAGTQNIGRLEALQLADAQSTDLDSAAAVGNRRKMALLTFNKKSDSTLQQSVLCQLSLLCPLGSLKTPVNKSKLVLSLSLLFSNVCCFNFFILSWSTKHQCLIESLLCQPHLYLYLYHPAKPGSLCLF